MKTTITENELDNMTHKVFAILAASGVVLGDDLTCDLNDCLSSFLTENCAIKINNDSDELSIADALPSKGDFNFTLTDDVVDNETTGYVETTGNTGLVIHIDGFGDCTSQDHCGTPIIIEKYDGEVSVVIYGDINSEEPTHKISLEGARLEKRSPEDVCAGEVDVILTDDADRITYFSVGFDKAGQYYLTDSTFDGDEIGSHTINAFIGTINIDIDGNGWRDLESGGYIGEFIKNVVFGDRDAQEFLSNISELLGTTDAPGLVF